MLLVRPDHPLAGQKQVTMEEMGRQVVIAHNDPSPARERVLKMYEQRQAPLNIRLWLPSLDGIKRAVEMGLGVALLPRRCAKGEIAAWGARRGARARSCDRRARFGSSIAARAICRTRRGRFWRWRVGRRRQPPRAR